VEVKKRLVDDWNIERHEKIMGAWRNLTHSSLNEYGIYV
jgi:hypothetical protein